MVPFLIKSDPFSSIYPHQGRKSRLTKGERRVHPVLVASLSLGHMVYE